MADEGGDADADADAGADRGGDRSSGSPGGDTSPTEASDGGTGPGETWIEESEPGDDSEWRYRVVGEDDDGPAVGVATGETGDAAPDEEGEGEGVAGPFAPSAPVEPGTPDPENALFVATGVLLTLLVIASGATSLDAATVLVLAGFVAVAGGGLYGFFRAV